MRPKMALEEVGRIKNDKSYNSDRMTADLDGHATLWQANELVQPHGTYPSRVDVTLGIGAHSFRERDGRVSRGIRNKSLHRAIFRAANTDTALYAWVGLFVRLRVDRI